MSQANGSKGNSTPAAIIIAALTVTAGLLVAASPYGLGGAKTVTSTVVSTSTSFVATTIASPATSAWAVQFHKVIFNESAVCDNEYASRWAVTLGTTTISEPANATFPFSRAVEFTSGGEAISKIIFTLPDGTYSWNVSALTGLVPTSGTVTVHGSDAVVQIQAQPPGFCAGGLG